MQPTLRHIKKLHLHQKIWFALLILLTFFSYSTHADGDEWQILEGATIEQSRAIYVRGKGYYTDNTVILDDAVQPGNNNRLVITSNSHPVTNADGLDDNERPYFNLSNFNDKTRIEFGIARSQFSYTAEVYTLNEANPLPEITLNTPTTAPQGSIVRLAFTAEDPLGVIIGAQWQISNGLVALPVDGEPLKADLIIPEGLVGSTLSITAIATDGKSNEIMGTATIEVIEVPDFVAYESEQDSQPLDDVEIIATVSEDSNIAPATRQAYGYKTFVVSPAQGTIIEPQAGSLTIISGDLPDLAIGDIIVGINQDETLGFMRKVVAINGNVIATEKAAFADAFPDGKLNIELAISNQQANIRSLSTDKLGNSLQNDIDFNVGLLNFNQRISHHFGRGISAVADLSMNSSLNFSLDISLLNRRIESAESLLRANFAASTFVEYAMSDSASISVSKGFRPLVNKNIRVLVSGFPVLINVKVKPEIEASVSVSQAGSLKAGVTASGLYQSGFVYRANSGLTDIDNFSPTVGAIGPIYTMSGSMAAEAEVELDVTVSLYEISVDVPILGEIKFDGPGVGIDVGPYAEFIAEATIDSEHPNGFTCDIGLFVGLNSELEFDYGDIGDLLDVENPDDIDLFDLRKRLYTETACPFEPVVSNINGFVVDETGNALNGVNVRLFGDVGGHSNTTSTNSNGYFEFLDVTIGEYSVTANKTNYFGESQSFTLSEEGKTLTLVLVEDPDGEGDGEGTDDPNENGAGQDDNGNLSKAGSSMGDPHLRTFDGLSYDFQGAGEYVMVKSTDDDFEIQARMQPWSNGRRISVNTAISANVNGDRIGFYRGGIKLSVLINGVLTNLPTGTTQLSGGGEIRSNNGYYNVRWPDGSNLDVRGNSVINIKIALSNARRGKVSGLLGNFDGRLAMELFTASGEVYTYSKNEFNELYSVFGASWQVTEETTLFDYFDNQSLQGFTDQNFPSGSLTLNDLQRVYGNAEYQRVSGLCRQFVNQNDRLNACILDALVTGIETNLQQYRDIAKPVAAIELPETGEVKITSPLAGATVNSNVRVSGSWTSNNTISGVSYSVNNDELTRISIAPSNSEFLFSIPASRFNINETNVITVFVDSNEGIQINDQVSLFYDTDQPPLASGDIFVINDVNAFDNTHITVGDNLLFFRNLVDFSGEGARINGNRILFDYSHNTRCNNCVSLTMLFNNWIDTGFEVLQNTNSGSLETLLDDLTVKVVVLWTPRLAYSASEIESLKQFAREGGRIVFVGEHAGFYGAQGLSVQNEFLNTMGARMQNLGFSRHGGHHRTTFDTENPHQLVQGIDPNLGVVVNYVSILDLGPSDYPILFDSSGTDVIAGIATIDLTENNDNLVNKVAIESLSHKTEQSSNPPSPIVHDNPHQIIE